MFKVVILKNQCRRSNWLLSTSKIGCDPRVLNDRGRNCLHLASQRGELPCIEALVAAGADCDFPDEAGNADSLHSEISSSSF